MTVAEFQAKRIQRIAAALSHFISTTPEDRLSWEPDGLNGAKGRSIISMVSEIVVVNNVVAGRLSGELSGPPKPATKAPQIEFSSAQDAQDQLVASGEKLSNVVANLTDENLETEYEHWAGMVRGEIWIEMAYRNMAYHAGQINYIQVLLGDDEFHVPPGNWR